ncbi:BTB/POZ domain-containing protein At5g41330 [Dioscorea cayenensis subsp. rotundata]|uniref:BTB/POZ domain-containing protein At5g41330 n=1 Tax=Dioscorea cayennensis subsp. rotundata TaxID=55577 RepID=A0AB40CEK0_DIOCR|nr:BTB/POZ domain-containing protein At5g41330 [Dioscorea cayenensis subsp. rotundata]XP_039138372.1 BTB/POZ domain-containing protein At5g41330 [Dioscorea cayenensis subsp. rotundata]
MAETSSPAIAGESQPSIPTSSIVSINVGGELFQTTTQTLSAAGAGSVLATLPAGSVSFFDRDPSLFSSLLSLLRSSSPPANPSDLLPELRFFSIDPLLLLPKFDPFSLQRSLLLPLHGRNHPSALAAGAGSIHVGHGGKITTFDSTLSRRATVLTPLPAIDSLLSISPSLVAAGASDFPSVHLINIPSGHVNQTLDWSPTPLNSSPPSIVQALTSSLDHLFASFESSRRTSNAIVAFDLNTFTPATEIARGEIYGAELDSAIPATKLKWVESLKLLMAAGSHAGPSGLTGNIRLWDVRSGAAVWESPEKVDCFADVTVCDALLGIFKIGLFSGDVFFMDLRKIGSGESSWMCLGDQRKGIVNGRKEGNGCRIESYGNQVFVSRGEEVEMWSSVSMAGAGEKVMKKNLMGKTEKHDRNRIVHMAFGCNRMVIARKDEHCVEVWQSSC